MGPVAGLGYDGGFGHAGGRRRGGEASAQGVAGVIRSSGRFVSFAGESRSPFPTGRKLLAGIVKSFPAARRLAHFLLDTMLAYVIG